MKQNLISKLLWIGTSTMRTATQADIAKFWYETSPFSWLRVAEPYAGIKREFVSFSSAAAENAQSRVFAGLHFPSATQAGLVMGRNIGRQAARTVLLPVKR